MSSRSLFNLFFAIVLTLGLFSQCRGDKVPKDNTQVSGVENASFSGLSSDIQSVFDDTSSSPKELLSALAPYTDSLLILARDENNQRNRIAAQILSYQAIELLSDRCGNDSDDEADVQALNNMASRLLDAIGQWFYSEEEGVPCIWQDLYYVSQKDSDNPINGYFHIMVLLPTEERPDAELDVFFPDNAVSMPYLAFTKFRDANSLDEDYENVVSVQFNSWHKKDEIEVGYPLYGVAGQDVVDLMLNQDVMYLWFSNSENPDDDDIETARISLSYFQKKYREHESK